ncbi:hypothetical protein C4D60_Mb02t05980 [Musa balbisiana]|uniref:PAR1 protein n=1 Tax=Musa balbisiana TaxID=52838 RepID=A0A4S8IAW9_MUSBA|nr:hypothetical protein C4D60_Mb02t05980 [Musa balbisiana]
MEYLSSYIIASASRIIPWPPKFFASFGLLIVFCASEARGNLPLSSHQPRRARHDVRSLDAVSAAGTRCVLERNARGGRPGAYTCAASEIAAEGFSDWVETDECVAACALDRGTVGISSDALLDADFMRKLCSPDCYYGCPNVLDLYFNIAAAEGTMQSVHLITRE